MLVISAIFVTFDPMRYLMKMMTRLRNQALSCVTKNLPPGWHQQLWMLFSSWKTTLVCVNPLHISLWKASMRESVRGLLKSRYSPTPIYHMSFSYLPTCRMKENEMGEAVSIFFLYLLETPFWIESSIRWSELVKVERKELAVTMFNDFILSKSCHLQVKVFDYSAPCSSLS